MLRVGSEKERRRRDGEMDDGCLDGSEKFVVFYILYVTLQNYFIRNDVAF